VTKDNMFIHKLAVVNGEVVEDVAQVPDHVDEKQQQEELEQTLRYIEQKCDPNIIQVRWMT